MDNPNTPTPAIDPQGNNSYGGAVLEGIGQPGSAVKLDVDGVKTPGSVTVAADGTWLALTSLQQGVNNITVDDTNAAGLEGTSDTLTIKSDNTKPSNTVAPYSAFGTTAIMQNATTAELQGLSTDPDGVKEVDISSDGKLLGQATLKPASHDWSFSFDQGAGDFADITATAIDAFGNTSEISSPFELITGITGQPYKSEQITDSADGSIQNAAYYGSNGSLLYQSTSTFDAKGDADAIITGAGSKLTYDANKSDPHDEITNFNAKGNNHDTLSVAGSNLHNMSQLMSHSSFADGDLTIHLTGHSEITLDGVSKADLKSHASDIKFA